MLSTTLNGKLTLILLPVFYGIVSSVCYLLARTTSDNHFCCLLNDFKLATINNSVKYQTALYKDLSIRNMTNTFRRIKNSLFNQFCTCSIYLKICMILKFVMVLIHVILWLCVFTNNLHCVFVTYCRLSVVISYRENS